MAERGEVLIAIMNNWHDWQIVREKHWYRIPVKSAPRRFPPQWLAFYQTKIFGDEAYAINYFARVIKIRQVPRRLLFPETPVNHPKFNRQYYQSGLFSSRAVTPKAGTRNPFLKKKTGCVARNRVFS